VKLENIEERILLIRDQKVMLDADLAALYRASTKHLNEQVKRNSERFPEDFMFQLTKEESEGLNNRPGVNGHDRRRRYRPYAFTEQGAGMLASVLRSPVATKVSVEILRAFGRLRQDEEPPPPSPYERPVRSLFAAIRDAVLFLPGDERYTTSEPFTYFLQAGTEGPIKIGSTRNLLVRLRTLYAMSPLPLKLLGVMKGEVAEERCHIRLGAFRLHGEWFAPSPVILDFISENATSPNIVARLIGQGQNGRG
jgi:hypothetical protein